MYASDQRRVNVPGQCALLKSGIGNLHCRYLDTATRMRNMIHIDTFAMILELPSQISVSCIQQHFTSED